MKRLLSLPRQNLFGLLSALITLVLYLWIFANDKNAHSPGSDGAYSWLFARSIVFDGDIDFANDYALCGDPLRQAIFRGTGRLDNPFYAGPALFWVPVLAILRTVVSVAPDIASHVNACKGPLTMWALTLAPILGAGAIWLSYRAARRIADDGPAALAAIVFALGSSLYAYATVLPSYSHVYATFATSALVLVSLRAGEASGQASYARWLHAGIWLGIAVLQRPTNVIFALVPAAVAYIHLRGVPRRLLLSIGFVGLASMPFVLAQLGIYQYLYGNPFTTPQGPHYLSLGRPHPFLLLFAPHGGLFPTAPAAWLSAFGAVLLVWRRETRIFAGALLVVFALEVWISSSALDWHGNATFGARRLTTLTPVFVIFAAASLKRIRDFLETRPALSRVSLAIACILPLGFAATGAVWSLPRSGVPLSQGPMQAELWGQGTTVAWSLVDDRVGTLASLPAQWAFSWRYGLPGPRFRDATESPWYIRNYRNLRFYAQRLPMSDRRLGRTMTGFSQDRGGARMVSSQARVVFAAQWRSATKYRILGSAARDGVELRVGHGLAFGRVQWFGSVRLTKEASEEGVAIPEGAFGAGLNELVFEIVGLDEETAGVQLSSITIDDERDYGPPLAR